jgi:FO synthase subunit 2
MRPKEIRQLVRATGRTPAQRSTTYKILKSFADEEEEKEDHDSRLDNIDSSAFGSYHQLIKLDKFKFRDAKRNRTV